MANIDIKNYPKVIRFNSGFFGMDYALRNPKTGEIGSPACIYEVYGNTSIGKSTFCWELAAARNLKGKISIIDLEMQDPERILDILNIVGYEGDVEFILEEKDEKTLDEGYKALQQENVSGFILDSVGVISPIAEREGDTGAANMGRRAKLMADFSRKLLFALRFRKEPPVVCLITHVHPNLGGFGRVTSGGIVKDYVTHIKLSMSKQESEKDGSHAVIKCTVDKNRYGLPKQQFFLSYIPERGFHRGLTAVNDCLTFELAQKSRTISMDGVSYGYMSNLIKDAVEGKEETFTPFIKKLEEYRKELEK